LPNAPSCGSLEAFLGIFFSSFYLILLPANLAFGPITMTTFQAQNIYNLEGAVALVTGGGEIEQ